MCSTWPGRLVRTASIFSNGINDRTARRTTQAHVRKRSDVLRRLGRIATGIATLGDLASPIPVARLALLVASLGWARQLACTGCHHVAPLMKDCPILGSCSA